LLYPANRRMIVVQEPANGESRVIRLLRFRRELMIVLRRLNQREEATMARSGSVGVPLSSDRPSHFDWSAYNVRTDVDKEKLQLIGAICLEWNFIEDIVDYALFHAWEMQWDASVEVASRINGMEGKFAIIKRCVRTVARHPEPIPSIIDTTIDAVAEYKRYRDGVVHARLLDPKSNVATLSVNRGRADEVLISNDALDGLLM
jgi:hypothetical protein